jgi:cAMP-specific phosphodiesterase 4
MDVRSWSDPVLALCYVLHCADISNPARPWRLAREWGARVSEEFYKQGDRERALGVPVAALNDRDAAGANAAATTAANQLAFARYVVEPTLEGLMTIAPGAVEVMLQRLRENTAKYARVVAGETVE